VLAGHEPYPAIVVDRQWNVVEANASVSLFTALASQELLTPPLNALRVSLHPNGMAPYIVNLGEWRAHLLGRLRRQIALTSDRDVEALYAELLTYPCDQAEQPVAAHGSDDVVVPLRLRLDGRELAFFSLVASFGTPVDITVAELAIESFYPADAATAAVLRSHTARAVEQN
jgi:hypothetical protein